MLANGHPIHVFGRPLGKCCLASSRSFFTHHFDLTKTTALVATHSQCLVAPRALRAPVGPWLIHHLDAGRQSEFTSVKFTESLDAHRHRRAAGLTAR